MAKPEYKGQKDETLKFKDGSRIIKSHGTVIIEESIKEYEKQTFDHGILHEPAHIKIKSKEREID